MVRAFGQNSLDACSPAGLRSDISFIIVEIVGLDPFGVASIGETLGFVHGEVGGTWGWILVCLNNRAVCLSNQTGGPSGRGIDMIFDSLTLGVLAPA